MAKENKNQTLALYRKVRANKAASDREKLSQAVKSILPKDEKPKGYKKTAERTPPAGDGNPPVVTEDNKPPEGDGKQPE